MFFQDLAVVEASGLEVALAAIELGDIIRALHVLAAEGGDLLTGVIGTSAIGVAREVVLKGLSGTVEIAHVLVAAFGFLDENDADAVLAYRANQE